MRMPCRLVLGLVLCLTTTLAALAQVAPRRPEPGANAEANPLDQSFRQQSFPDQLNSFDVHLSFDAQEAATFTKEIFLNFKKELAQHSWGREISLTVITGTIQVKNFYQQNDIIAPEPWEKISRQIALLHLKNLAKTTSPFAQFLAKVEELLGDGQPLVLDPQATLTKQGFGLYVPRKNVLVFGPYVLGKIIQAESVQQLMHDPIIVHELFHAQQEKLRQQGIVTLTSGKIIDIQQPSKTPIEVQEVYAYGLSFEALAQQMADVLRPTRRQTSPQPKGKVLPLAKRVSYLKMMRTLDVVVRNLQTFLDRSLQINQQALKNLKKLQVGKAPFPGKIYPVPYAFIDHPASQSIRIPIVMLDEQGQEPQHRFDYFIPQNVIHGLTPDLSPAEVIALLSSNQAMSDVLNFLQQQEKFLLKIKRTFEDAAEAYEKVKTSTPVRDTRAALQNIVDDFFLPSFEFLVHDHGAYEHCRQQLIPPRTFRFP